MTDPRLIDGGDLRALLTGTAQEPLLEWLEEHRPSAHSDPAADLLDAGRATCGDWVAFSPSFGSCRYVALITDGRVFSLAHGQRFVCFRVRGAQQVIALESGGMAKPELGAGWMEFQLYRPSHPKVDLRFWTLRAYEAAREAPPADDAATA